MENPYSSKRVSQVIHRLRRMVVSEWMGETHSLPHLRPMEASGGERWSGPGHNFSLKARVPKKGAAARVHPPNGRKKIRAHSTSDIHVEPLDANKFTIPP